MTVCTINGCEKDVRARGWCAMHWLRWSRHGDVNRGRSTSSYSLAHQRIRREQGKASSRNCANCNRTAQDWSYMGGDPNEGADQSGPSAGRKYSLDWSYYEPLCRNCHSQRDIGGAKHPRTNLTEEQVVAMRSEWKSGATPTELGKRYGISQSGVSRIVHGWTWKHLVIRDE